MAHVAILPRDEVRVLCGRLFEAHRLFDPRRAHEDALPAHGVHVFVFNPTERARGEARTHDQRIYRSLGRLTERERLDSALDNLIDVLNGAADDRPAPTEEARKEVVEVGRCVNRVRVEGVAGFGARVERLPGKLTKLEKASPLLHWYRNHS